MCPMIFMNTVIEGWVSLVNVMEIMHVIEIMWNYILRHDVTEPYWW